MTKEKLNKLDFVKVKNFWASKDTTKKTNRQAMKWEKIFAKHAYDKGLVSRIYKELFQLNKETNNSI